MLKTATEIDPLPIFSLLHAVPFTFVPLAVDVRHVFSVWGLPSFRSPLVGQTDPAFTDDQAFDDVPHLITVNDGQVTAFRRAFLLCVIPVLLLLVEFVVETVNFLRVAGRDLIES